MCKRLRQRPSILYLCLFCYMLHILAYPIFINLITLLQVVMLELNFNLNMLGDQFFSS